MLVYLIDCLSFVFKPYSDLMHALANAFLLGVHNLFEQSYDNWKIRPKDRKK